MDKTTAEQFNSFREVCLKNAEDLLQAAQLLLDKKLDHIAFHLSALALEEIGKISLMEIKLVAETTRGEDINPDIEDHEKKIFWAIWAPSFGREKVTRQQIEQQRGLAKTIHERRKRYLYVDPADPSFWQEKMREDESKRLYDLVHARYMYETSIEGIRTDLSEEESSDLKWFVEASSDRERRKEIFGSKSQKKLMELGDVKQWIKWLREVYKKNEEEMLQITKEELNRARPQTEQEAFQPKWKVRIKIVTPSHSIRNKPLNEFNQRSDFIKLYRGDANTLFIEIILSKAVPVHDLWVFPWRLAQIFVAALNIGTRGIFWWNVPIDTARYYEKMTDLERDLEVRPELNPRLSVNWKEARLVLGTRELGLASLLFDYLIHLWLAKQAEALDLYMRGLSLYAKNDIHLRLELSAFEQFFKVLKAAMKTNGHWDGSSDVKKSLHKQIDHFYKGDTKNMDKMLDLALEVESKDSTSQPVTLTEVVAMKAYCDLYLIESARDYEEKQTGRKTRLDTEEFKERDATQ